MRIESAALAEKICMLRQLIAWTLVLVLGISGSAQAATLEEVYEAALEASYRGEFVKAEQLWGEAIAIAPDNAALWSNRGNTRVSQNHLEEAIADYNESVRLAPNAPDPYLNRGTAWEGLQKWDQAIADYEQVLQIAPDDAAAHNNLGNVRSSLGDYEQALAEFETASRLAPGFAFAGANVALTLFQLDRVPEALQRMRSLVRKYPNFADMRAALTAVLWQQGQRGEAESNWVAVMGLDSRYRDLDWVRQIRRWPPAAVTALEQFLALQ